MHVEGEPKGEMEGMMEDYIAQCEKAMETIKGEDLPKFLQTKMNEQKRERENKALKTVRTPPKMAETVPTPTIPEARTSPSIIPVTETN